MSATTGRFQRRLLLAFVGLALITAGVTAAATITGFLLVANQHPIGANRYTRRIIGWLPAHPSTQQVVVTLAVIGVVLVCLAVSTALSLGRRVLRPVGELAGAAEQMAIGDLAVRVHPDGDDEIADVGRSFNMMADSLEDSVRTLRHLEATARRFAADVSHELRTPLTAMTAVTDVLSAHAPGMDPEAGRATHLVVREIAHLDRLVTDLIEMSRFDAGTAQLRTELVDVGAAITTCLEIRGWRDHVQVDVPPGLTAELDVRRFDVIVANLVGNAIKYGAPPVSVVARDGLELEVTDHGPGIPPEALPHLFDRFYKADTARTRSDGSGLGLAIALENARLHGGEISAGNRTDGAAFRLTLPHPPHREGPER